MESVTVSYGIKFVDVPKDRKLSGQRLPLSGSARHRRLSSGSAQKDERHGSSNSQREIPNETSSLQQWFLGI
jgi:hypothetical protein